MLFTFKFTIYLKLTFEDSMRLGYNFIFFCIDPICPTVTLIFNATFSSSFHMGMHLFMGSLLSSNCLVIYFDKLKLASTNYNHFIILLSDFLLQGYLSYLIFYINFSLSSSMRNPAGNWIGVSLNFKVNLGRINIFVILSFPI